MAWENKNQDAWVELFKSRPIQQDLDENGYHLIGADDIAEQREPRLMTKFDNSDSLPKVLKDADCSPISISRTGYALIRPHKMLFKILEEVKSEPIAVPINDWQEKIVTIPWGQILKSEAQAIDQAYILPILKTFFEERELWGTIRGRSTLKEEVPIRFQLLEAETKTFPFTANGVQVEFDGGYESKNSIYLIEAKIEIPTDINLRQFYFPYWHWVKNLELRSKSKPIRLIFLAYSAHSYYLYEFKFADPQIINSLETVKTGRYVVGELEFSWAQLSRELALVNKSKKILNIPFPQADEFERIINVVELIKISEEATPQELAENYQFTLRQSDYYANAAMWLGWLEETDLGWALTAKGRELLASKSLSEMARKICSVFSERPVVGSGLREMLKQKFVPEKQFLMLEINKALSQNEIKPISGETIPRRAQTIRSWLTYMLNLIKEK